MLTMYPAIFYAYPDGKYSVVFPDLNHLATCGDDFNEAMSMAVDCLAGYIHGEKLDGREVPAPTPLDKVDPHCEDDEDDEEVAGSFVNVVAVDVAEYARTHFEKPVKKTITVPADLNQLAVARGINFSKLMKKALVQELGLA